MGKPTPFAGADQAAAHRIEPFTCYRATLSRLAFGHIPREDLLAIVSNGRVGGILLEYELAHAFGLTHGGQGAAPDLHDGPFTIQVKTFHKQDPTDRFIRGRNAGRPRAEVASIWTTKSGFFDRVSRMTDADRAEAEAYIGRYDYFLYLDLSRIAEGAYEFVMLPSGLVAQLKEGFHISQAAIYSQVTATAEVPD